MPYPLRTERLSIEPLGEGDVASFVAYRTVASVARYQSWTIDYTETDARKLIAAQPAGELPEAGAWLQLAIRNADGTELYGDLAIHRLDEQPDTFELGVTLAPAAQGHGFAQEALATIIGHLFDDVRAHRLIAVCDTRNHSMARLLGRLGFRKESSQIEADFFKDEWTTVDGYAMLAREHTRTQS